MPTPQTYNNYHPDHLGSSSWITFSDGSAVQHLHYLPWGEDFVNQRISGYDGARYTFSAKEKDTETGYSYFGSRYYNSDLSIWLSVDPMAAKYPSLSPYVYCADNPVRCVDPNGEEIDWVEKADGTIYWDDNAVSQETTKKGETYLGKNVLVATHARDENLNEPINAARFDLYLESDHSGPTASISGNTIPCDVDAYGTLKEGLYKADGTTYHGNPALIITDFNTGSSDLPTVKGNPNNKNNYYDPITKKKMKPVSEHIMSGIYFHIGNAGREALKTLAGRPITEGCQTGPHGANTKDTYLNFATHFNGFHGTYYLRRKKTVKPYKCKLI